MKKLSILLAFISLVVLWGCGGDGDKKVDDPDYPDNPEQPTEVNLYLSTSELIFETEGGIKEFDIYCDADWTITYTSDWCEADIKDGQGNRTITLTAIASEEYSDRKFNLTVKAGTATKLITIIQKKKNALILTKDKYELPDEGGQIKVEVKSNIDYDIMIPSTNLWIKQVQTRSLNTDSLIFNIDQNYNKSQRSGIIIVRNQKENLSDTITIYQEAYETPSLILTQDQYTLPSKDTTIKVELKTNVDYNIIIYSGSEAWIQEVSTRAIRTDVITLHILANESYVNRSATIKIENKNNPSVCDRLYIFQMPKYAIIVSQKEYNLPALGGNIEVDVQSNTGYDIIISDDSKVWIQQIQTRSLNKNKESFKILPNSVESERTGWIIFKDKKSELSDTITVKQKAKTDCYEGSYYFGTVEDLKAFKDAGYKKIAGNVLIKGDFKNLQELDNVLQEIKGNLTIEATWLTSLDGLYNLSKIGGDMILKKYGGITFEGLNKLNSIGGNFEITPSTNGVYIDYLKSFEGLENLTTINGDFKIDLSTSYGLTALASFKGLNRLNSIGGNFKIISIVSLINLTSFEGLESLTTINGDLEINSKSQDGLNALASFKGLNKLSNIGGNFKIENCRALSSFEGLENLVEINNDFNIVDSHQFASFKGLNKLSNIGGNFKIENCRALSSFEGLENLVEINNDFNVDGDQLASFKGLNKLNNIGGSFKIENCRTLSSFEGLENLVEINNDFNIVGGKFTSFEGLNKLNSIGGNFSISSFYLTSFKGLESLAKINNNFIIKGCDFLSSFEGLENLVEINNDFNIVGGKFTSFEGLNKLNHIGGKFSISSSYLTSFKGLENLSKINNNFIIKGGDSLSSFEGLNNLTTINGYFEISSSSLSSLEGLNSLKTITNYLNIDDCDYLNNIDALKNLSTVKEISITSCPKLYDFCILKDVVQNNNSTFYTNYNGYNPTKYQLLNGECSKQPK